MPSVILFDVNETLLDLTAGCAAAYIARSPHPYHPAFPRPDIIGPDLTAVTTQLLDRDI